MVPLVELVNEVKYSVDHPYQKWLRQRDIEWCDESGSGKRCPCPGMRTSARLLELVAGYSDKPQTKCQLHLSDGGDLGVRLPKATKV